MSLFTCDYAVVIDRPFDEVYKYLTSSDHARAVVAASDLFAWFKEGERIGPDKLTFTMAERVPVLCGLFYSELTVEAEQEVDTERKMLHYNSRANSGMVLIHKERRFEALGEGRTRVVEHIDGRCPWFLKRIVQAEARTAHKRHMDNYHTLFERPPAPSDQSS